MRGKRPASTVGLNFMAYERPIPRRRSNNPDTRKGHVLSIQTGFGFTAKRVYFAISERAEPARVPGGLVRQEVDRNRSQEGE